MSSASSALSRPTWAEVSLSRLRGNFRLIQQHVGRSVTVCAVVKANAYGHGVAECARALEQEGAIWLGVTSTDEGLRLRAAGIRARILLMTGFWRGEEEEIVRQKLTPAVWQRESIDLLNRAANRLGSRAEIHVKVDTGMSRLGVASAEVDQFIDALLAAANLRVEGVFTHFACAEIVDSASNARQLQQFEATLVAFRRNGISPQFIHACNSSAIVSLPQARYNFVRPGISLYGYYLPFLSASGRPSEVRGLPVEPVLSLKTTVIGLRQVAAGASLGYGGTFTARRPMIVAVLPIGYADGLNRQLSSVGRVLVRGQVASIVGRISMDVTLADVTEIANVAIGDQVTIIGRDGDHRFDAWEHATLANTIPYEILCAISARVPRRYVSH